MRRGHVLGLCSVIVTLWEFLKLPSTGVKKRRVGVSKAGQIIPVEWMPKILAAKQERSRERGMYNFGIAVDPVSAYMPPPTFNAEE